MEHLKIPEKNLAKQGWGFAALAWDSLSGTFWPGDTGHQTVRGTSSGLSPLWGHSRECRAKFSGGTGSHG